MLEHIELPTQYKIGHEKLDEQHAKLFVILMHVIKLVKNEENKNEKMIEEELNEMIRHLRSYTQSHFVYEEHHMDKIKYPESDAHKQLHKTFIESIIEIQKKALKYRLEKRQMLKEMAIFLKDWYMKHILEEDKKIIAFESDLPKEIKTQLKMKGQSPS